MEEKKIIYKSNIMSELFESVERVAKQNTNVLITGESGTGKELIAHAIHNKSLRHKELLVIIDCSAIPENLIESELFGHEKGAFTGAGILKKGKFEIADGGTIFLDEIGELPMNMQPKLLRVIQERKFTRIGGIKTINVDVRIIAATNQNLEQAVKDKKFRGDLYYRLNVYPIQVPPLRERKEDIPLLIEHFIQKFKVSDEFSISDLDESAVNALVEQDWMGNVRELENVIEKIMIDGIQRTSGKNYMHSAIKPVVMNKPSIINEVAKKYLNLCVEILKKENQTIDQVKIIAKQLGIWQTKRGITGIGRQLIKAIRNHKELFQYLDRGDLKTIFDVLCLNDDFKREQFCNIESLINSLQDKKERSQYSDDALVSYKNKADLQEFNIEDFRIPINILRSLFVPTLIYDSIKGTGLFKKKRK